MRNLADAPTGSGTKSVPSNRLPALHGAGQKQIEFAGADADAGEQKEESAAVGRIDDKRPVGLPLVTLTPKLNELMHWFYHGVADIIAIGKLEAIQPVTQP